MFSSGAALAAREAPQQSTRKNERCFCIINLGCKVNRVEADSIAAQLLAQGATLGALEDAELVLINTCTVTGEADTKSRKAVRRALREAPHASVIVCGCAANANPEQFEDLGSVEIIPNKVEALKRAASILKLLEFEPSQAVMRVGDEFNTRVAIKVQDGCNNSCSYCIVPRARGAASSVPLKQALQEIELQLKAGAREIVLTGIDLGSYRDQESTLEHLLEAALSLDDKHRLRLSSIELGSISDELLALMVKERGRICAHLHVPLQSGSDAILKAMNRKYDVASFINKAEKMKRLLPGIALSTDVIVGFPGETEADYAATLEVCKKIAFNRIHVFRYSKRPGTPAAELPGTISVEEMADRAERLRRLSEQLAAQDAKERVGSQELVLCESESSGRSESYCQVRFLQKSTRGKLATMTIVDYKRGELIAEECKN